MNDAGSGERYWLIHNNTLWVKVATTNTMLMAWECFEHNVLITRTT